MLSILIFAPFVGALALLFIKKEQESLIKTFATIVSIIPLLLSVFLLMAFNRNLEGFQFQEILQWIPALGIKYHLGLDGISLSLLLLTTLLSTLCIIYSWNIKDRVKEYFFLFLMLEAGILGVFLSLDLFLFYLFWEASLLPMYFIIGIWGGKSKNYASIKFFLYTFFGSLAMLLSILILFFNSNPHTFDLLEISRVIDPRLGIMVFTGFFLGFAIKVPLFPFHTWLPDAHVEAPTAGSVMLAGVLLKMGGYGFIRFLLPIIPNICAMFAWPIAILALASIIYGAMVALSQTDLKKQIAYSSVNHMGFVMLGLAAVMMPSVNAAAKATALSGLTLQMISHGLITGGLFFLIGMIYDRTHTRNIPDFGGLANVVPIFSMLFCFFAFASLGLPGLSGFTSELMIFIGSFPILPIVSALAIIGVLATTIMFLRTIQQSLFGPKLSKFDFLKDLNSREIFCLAVLVVLIIFLGIYPMPAIHVFEKSLAGLLL